MVPCVAHVSISLSAGRCPLCRLAVSQSLTVQSPCISPTEVENEMYGLICEARTSKREIQMPLSEFEVDEDDPGLRMLADYCSWFWNYR